MAKSKELQTVVSFAGKVDPSLTSAALKAGKQMQKVQQSIKKTGLNIAKGFGKAVKGIGVGVLATATAATVALSGMAVQGLSLASDLQEVQNVVSTTFKDGEGAINDFASTALNKFGITELNAKQFSGTLGAMFKSMNVGDKQMLAMSKNLSALSGDMASFYNLDATEAFDKIRAGISGEAEPLKQLGINMSVANLEDFAKAQGESKKFANMSQAEQAMLRYGYLMEATADAQGDFNKTSDGYANQQRLLKENFKQLSGRIMQGVLPALASGMKVVNKFMESFDTKPFEKIVSVFGDIVVKSLPVVNKLLPLVSGALESIAPLFGTLLDSLKPVAETIFPIFKNLMDACNPLIDKLAKTLMPILTTMIEDLSNELSPLIPSMIDLLIVLAPLLKLVAPILKGIIKLFNITASPLGFINEVMAGKVAKKEDAQKEAQARADAMKEQAKLDAERRKAISEHLNNYNTYANGGFASRASIFGEAGLEAAIPIKPGNPRSLGLLMKTAQMLGVNTMTPQVKPFSGTRNGTYVLQYSPHIHGDSSGVESALKRGFNEAQQMFEDWVDEQERTCYG